MCAASLGMLLWGGVRASAQQSDATPRKIGATLRMVIPANVGGGWDQTGRALGAALKDSGVVGEVTYENVGGKGGINGLSHYVARYASDPNTLLVGGMVMVGALELHKPSINLKKVSALSRIASDYVVVAVPPDSPIRSVKDFQAALRQKPEALAIAGGSAGGVDHMFAGMLAHAAKLPPEKLVFKPYSGGGDVVKAILAGEAQVAISGYSEMGSAFSSGRLRAIGVSSRASILGLPSFREQNVDADIANWRAIFTGSDVSPERRAQLTQAIETAVAHDTWKRAVQANGWGPSWQTGKELDTYIDMQTMTAQVMNFMLKLKSEG